MIIPRLLAKSSRNPDAPKYAETLVGHLCAVTRVAVLLAERWGNRHLISVGLDPQVYGPRLQLALPRAAFAHDLGKANDHFQRILRSDPSIAAQAGWHEQLSVWLLLSSDKLRYWLLQDCEAALRQAVLVAVLGHHLRVDDASAIGLRGNSGTLRLTMLSGHPDFAGVLRGGANLLGLVEPPVLADVVLDLVSQDAFDLPVRRWLGEAMSWWRSALVEERRFVAALKALVIASDVAGSVLPRQQADPSGWADAALARTCVADDLQSVVDKRLDGKPPRSFQQAVADSSDGVTFVRAGCGSGKTAAAYLWAVRRACGRKLFFCYPTTGTASQGFADYVPPDQFEAALVHSRAAADLEDLLTSGKADGEDRLEWLTRFAALVTWDAPIAVCTVDSVLGLIQNSRSGLFSFPSIANGAFVFDEIHQYDDRLFGALLRFLEGFPGVPLLLMTASLPRGRLDALRACVAQLGEHLAVVEGPGDLEALKRYKIEAVGDEHPWERVVEAVRAGQRVLWVANTVDRAISLAQEAQTRTLSFLPYHGRYRYEDRLERHGAVIQAFTNEACAGVLATTTQVCEVSLDISADLLVTDLAPIPALIQRLGRLNRRVSAAVDLRAAPALVVEPPGPLPYAAEELGAARRWLDALVAAPCCQADLAEGFDRLVGGAPIPTSVTRSAWLDGGVLAARAALREEGTTIPVIREEDTHRLRGLSAGRQGREMIRLTMPMPLGPVAGEVGAWSRVKGVLIVPVGRLVYDELLGGRWR